MPIRVSPLRAFAGTFLALAAGHCTVSCNKSSPSPRSADETYIVDFVAKCRAQGKHLELPRDVDRLNGLLNRACAPRGYYVDRSNAAPYFSAQVLNGVEHRDFPHEPTFAFPELSTDAPIKPHWIIADDVPLPRFSRGVSLQEGGGMIWLSRREAAENHAAMSRYFSQAPAITLSNAHLDMKGIGAVLYRQSEALYARNGSSAQAVHALRMSGYHEMEHLYATDYLPPLVNAAVNHLQGGSIREARTNERSCITQAIELLADLGSLVRMLKESTNPPTWETQALLISVFEKNNYTGPLPSERYLQDAATLVPVLVLSCATRANDQTLHFDYAALQARTEALAQACRDFLLRTERETLLPNLERYFQREGVNEDIISIAARETKRYQRERGMGEAEAGLAFWREFLTMLHETPPYEDLCIQPIENYTMGTGIDELHHALLKTLGLTAKDGEDLRKQAIAFVNR